MRAAIGAVAVFALVALGLIALVNIGATIRRPVAVPASYWPVDDSTIEVMIGNGIGIECGVASVTESATDVRVQSECDEPWVSGGGTGALKLTVSMHALATPLGNRTVIDGQGHPAKQCPSEAACP
jgi:hypothetical protein